MHVWLDDERDPTNPRFKGKGAEPDMVWVKTVDEAIDLLKTGNVLSISLDNDLGRGQKEGYLVADFIEESAYNGTLKELGCYAHTDNIVRRNYMNAAFRSARRAWRNV